MGAPSPRTRPWLATATLAAGALLPLARVLSDPAGLVPGLATSDVYKHTWAYWHTLQVVAEGTWPRTDLLGAPAGGVFLDVMLGPALVMAPITATAGPVIAANLWVLASLLAVGLATLALARECDLSGPAATAAALAAQTAPYLLGYPLVSGVHERLAVWVFPLVVLAVLRLARGGRPAWALVPPLSIAWVALGSPVYGLLAAMVLALAAPLALLERPPRRRLLLLAASCAGAAAALGALLAAVRRLWRHPDLLVPPVHLGPLSWDGRLATTAGELLDPRVAAAVGPWAVDDELYMITYLGLVPVLAALAGVALAWRERRWAVVALGAGAGLFALLALGPALPGGVPNPATAVAGWVVPTWRSLIPVWQHVAVTSVLLLVPAALVLDRVPPGRWRWAAAALALALVLAERAAVVPVPLVAPVAEARVPAPYRAAQGPGALVDLPRFWPGTEITRGPAFLAQSVHGRPLPLAINHGFAGWDELAPLHHGEARRWPRVAACLRAGGFRWLAVHPAQVEDSHLAEDLVAAGARVTARDAEVVLLDLTPIRPDTTMPFCPASPGNQRRPPRVPRGVED